MRHSLANGRPHGHMEYPRPAEPSWLLDARRHQTARCSTVEDMQSHSTPRLLRAAGVVFAIGLAAIVALFVTPLVTDGDTAPTFVYLLTMCAPVGFILGIAFALRSGRRAR